MVSGGRVGWISSQPPSNNLIYNQYEEKAEVAFVESDVYFDKKDIEIMFKQTINPFVTKTEDIQINEYFKNMNVYFISFKSGESINNVLLSEEDLKYLCE